MDGAATLWDAKTGKKVRQFAAQGLSEIYVLTFSPDGKTIMAGGWSDTVENFVPIWAVETGRELFRFPQPAGVFRADFSSDSNYVLIGSDWVSHLWDVQTGTKIREFVGSGTFSPDGRNVVTVKASTGYIWDAQSGKEIRRFVGPEEGIGWGVMYAPDGKTVAAANVDGTVRLWDVQTGQELRRYPQSPLPNYVVYSPDSQYLVPRLD